MKKTTKVKWRIVPDCEPYIGSPNETHIMELNGGCLVRSIRKDDTGTTTALTFVPGAAAVSFGVAPSAPL